MPQMGYIQLPRPMVNPLSRGYQAEFDPRMFAESESQRQHEVNIQLLRNYGAKSLEALRQTGEIRQIDIGRELADIEAGFQDWRSRLRVSEKEALDEIARNTKSWETDQQIRRDENLSRLRNAEGLHTHLIKLAETLPSKEGRARAHELAARMATSFAGGSSKRTLPEWVGRAVDILGLRSVGKRVIDKVRDNRKLSLEARKKLSLEKEIAGRRPLHILQREFQENLPGYLPEQPLREPVGLGEADKMMLDAALARLAAIDDAIDTTKQIQIKGTEYGFEIAGAEEAEEYLQYLKQNRIATVDSINAFYAQVPGAAPGFKMPYRSMKSKGMDKAEFSQLMNDLKNQPKDAALQTIENLNPEGFSSKQQEEIKRLYDELMGGY